MKRQILHREDGLRKVRQLKERLKTEGVPFDAIYLYGSVARNQAHEWSDIDVAIVGVPFRATRHEENMVVRLLRRDIDSRIEPICLHSEDFQNVYFALAREIERTGVEA